MFGCPITRQVMPACVRVFFLPLLLWTSLSWNEMRGAIASAPAASPARTTAAKPWGELKIHPLLLENSSSVFPDRSTRLQKPAWLFENASVPQVLTFFESCDLSPFARAELYNTNQWTVRSNGCVVFPSHELILKLTPDERARIYAMLARSDENYDQRWPFRMPLNGFHERFGHTKIPPAKLELIHSLTYTNGHQLCLCNLATLQTQLGTNEFHELVEVLYAVPTILVRLHVGPDSDVDALVSYWGRGGREKRIRPLLESVANLTDGEDINLSFLLPEFARWRLYVYPDPESDAAEAKSDCLFTALNFFNEKADPRLLDPAVRNQALQTDYAPIHGQPTLGDLITLVKRTGETFHVAVYIAQDVVFTKNGENYLQPWVLMRMDDLMAFYGAEDPIRMIIFRRKNS